MFVYKMILCFVLMLCFARKVYSDEQHVGSGTFSGIAFEMLLTQLDLIQDRLSETDQKLAWLSQTIDQKLAVLQTETKAVMKEEREYIDQKLSGLEEKIDDKLIALQTQSNVVMKEHHQFMDLKLSHQEIVSKGLMRAIDQLGQRITKLHAQSNSIVKKDLESIDQTLVGATGSIKQLDPTINKLKIISSLTLKEYKETTDEKLNQLIQTIDDKFKALQALTDKTEQSATIKHEQTQKEIQKLASKDRLVLFKINPDMFYGTISIPSAIPSDPVSLIPSCKKNPSDQSGKYFIMSNKHATPFVGYCDQSVFGGGWLVFQYRFNGSVDFYRNWEAYRNGFGSLEGEFWLGLEILHQLTSARRYELLVELKDYSGVYKYARYDDFQIGSEAEKYALKKLGSYTGTAGNALSLNEGMKFTTLDQDNDIYSSGNCAVNRKGAWWYWASTHSNLNGIYKNANDWIFTTWYSFKKSWESMAYTRMSIREV